MLDFSMVMNRSQALINFEEVNQLIIIIISVNLICSGLFSIDNVEF